MSKPAITWLSSPNYGYAPTGSHGRQGFQVQAICHHISMGSLVGMDSWFASTRSGASSHFGIGKDGTIHQYVNIDDAAWCNGFMNKPDLSIPWLKACWDANRNPNLVTVSIEYEGAHPTNAAGQIINPNWAPTEAQYIAGLALTRWLCEVLGITASNNTVIGHYRIDAVTRPYCPGPKFPFARMLADLAAPTWALPKVRVVLPTGAEVWGRVNAGGKAVAQLPGCEAEQMLRPVAAAMGRTVRWSPTPPTAFVE